MPNIVQQGQNGRERGLPAPEPAPRLSEPPITEATALGEYIRIEHGRDGVRRYTAALLPFVSYSFAARLAEALRVEPPPPQQAAQQPQQQANQQAQQREGGLSPEKMLSLLQGMGGKDGGLDPAMLVKLLRG